MQVFFKKKRAFLRKKREDTALGGSSLFLYAGALHEVALFSSTLSVWSVLR